MNDTAPSNDLSVPAPSLNNYNHRRSTPPSISEPGDLVTKPTPAQRERLIYLADVALDALEDATMAGNRISDRIAAANSILDRAGLHSKGSTETTKTVAPIPAEALVQVIAGLAQVFGQKVQVNPSDVDLVDVSPPPPPPESPPPPPKQKRKISGGLPKDLLNHYEEDNDA